MAFINYLEQKIKKIYRYLGRMICQKYFISTLLCITQKSLLKMPQIYNTKS
ncbi:hypothetical protein HanPSC8_Chr07g0290451 [Helianthus annuus]|nr:hypothetical protein HanPSC8_Chr07g0290451 [Helianthus annuus]